MRDFLTVLKIACIGLIVAVIIYPAAHEGGHILATILAGGRLISLSWIPVPNVICEMEGINVTALSVISLAGIGFPILLVMLCLKTKRTLRFAALVFSGITVLSSVIALATVALNLFGYTVPNDDMTAFMSCSGIGVAAVPIMAVFCAVSIVLFIKLRPKYTLMSFLNLIL